MKHVTLTPRQFEIAKLLSEGLTQVEAAAKLGLSVRTVEVHVAQIRRRTDSTTTAQAVSRARPRGLGARTPN